MDTIRRYVALLWPLTGGLVMVLISAYVNANNGDSYVTAPEWVQIAIQGFSLLVVWATANLSTWPKMKGWAMGIMAVLNLLVSFVDGGLTFLEVLNLLVAFLSAVGVFVFPGPVTAKSVRDT